MRRDDKGEEGLKNGKEGLKRGRKKLEGENKGNAE